jgi:hypothetical protein
LKILKVVQKVEYKMPLILCGNTGCGKTYLINFIATCIFEDFLDLITMHTGTEESEFKQRIEDNVKCEKRNSQRHWIFFDEFNASHLMPLVTQLILERRMSWIADKDKQKIPDNIILVAACNPYNLRLVNKGRGEYKKDHNVNPLPQSIFYHIWNFGELDSADEKLYLNRMIEATYANSDLGNFDSNYDEYQARDLKKYMIDVISDFVMECHAEIRSNVNSTNAVSLRDMTRFIQMSSKLQKFNFPIEDALTLALYLVYFIRVEDVTRRELLDKNFKTTGVLKISVLTNFEKIAKEFETDFLKLKLYDPKTVDYNFALKENLIALYCAIVCDIPIVIFGPPGTSKTLSITLIEELFKASIRMSIFPTNMKYFTNTILNGFWSVNLWGSYLTTTKIINDTFDKAKRIKSLNNGSRVCIHFEEMSLAETAPGYPLKCLHGLLEESAKARDKVQFIGSANCAMDMSNGNRVLIITRGQPNEEDLASAFFGSGSQEKSDFRDEWKREISRFVESFNSYKKIEMRLRDDPEFHQLRDFYSMVKFINRYKSIVSEGNKEEKIREIRLLIEIAVMRNFSGRPAICDSFKAKVNGSSQMLASQTFLKKFWAYDYETRPKLNLKVIDLICLNLMERDSKHLMLITESQVVEEIITEQIKSFIRTRRRMNQAKIHTISGTNSQEDVIAIISKLPKIVKEPSVLILVDTPHVWGALYDLLNDKISEKDKRSCYLYYDNNKPKIEVHPEFKCIVLYNKRRYTSPMDGALLGRFEKYLIQKTDILTASELLELQKLTKKYMAFSPGSQIEKSSDACERDHGPQPIRGSAHLCDSQGEISGQLLLREVQRQGGKVHNRIRDKALPIAQD